MRNIEARPDATFNFLGTVIENQPEVLGELSPRDAYILLAHSDIKNARTLAEMATIFDVSTNTIGKVYKKAINIVFQSSSPQIQEMFPLDEIEAAIKARHMETAIQATRETFSDPLKREGILAKMSEGHRRSYKNNPELRRKTSLASTGRHHTEEAKEKIRARLKGRKRPLSVYANTIGKERTPEAKEKMRAARRKGLQIAQERNKLASYGFKGKKHTPEAKRKMSKPRGLEAKKHSREGAIKRWIKQDRGIRSSVDLDLWKYAVANGLLAKIVKAGYLTQKEADALKDYFEHDKKLTTLDRLLNQFSLGVANLD